MKRINSKFRNNKTETANGYPYVDLGLPSGLKWAKCNVGAEKETDYGYYFMWGDVEDHGNSAYRCTFYKHCNNTSYALTKYCNDSSCGTVDNKFTLEPEDDAARANMGGDWRMPTRSDFQELLENTENEWVEDFNGTGVNGRKFTSKTDTSKYVFIPAAGFRTNDSVNYVGSDGDVWGSSLDISIPDNAWGLTLNSSVCCMGYSYRCYGRSVRGVMK